MASPSLKPSQRFSAEDRRQQILEAATQLFAHQGFGGTTTRHIAQRAQVNEAIIFRHFPTKDDLYWAVIEHNCQAGQGAKIVAEQLARKQPPAETFAAIAREFLRSRERDSSLGRLLLFSALEHHELSHRFFNTHMATLYEELAGYIREQIEAGNFRPANPLLAARSFWGMVVYHFLVQELFGAKRYQEIDVEEASRTIADLWLNGMLPRVESTCKGSRDQGGRRGNIAARNPSEKRRQ